MNRTDLEIKIARSHGRNTTKGKKAVVLPIPKPLVPFLEHAIKTAPGQYLFPRPDGKRRHEKTGIEKVWRRILVRAGIVTGYRHTCRRCVARKQLPAQHVFPDAAIKRCPHPECGMRMWPAGIPRPMRFHDIRHTTATLLLKAGAPIQHVQRILRHANIRTTVDTYGHLANEDLRGPLDLLPKVRARVVNEASEQAAEAHVQPVCRPGDLQENEGPGLAQIALENRGLEIGAEHRVRTGDLRLGKAPAYLPSRPRFLRAA